GIEQYIELRREAHQQAGDIPADYAQPATVKPKTQTGGQIHAARKEAKRVAKEVKRLDRELARITTREAELHEQMETSATDHELLGTLQKELSALSAEREKFEAEWLVTSELLES
ncbi:MAG: hypothetical protein JHC87_07450, partial [Thermoleophilaceae bacterium]|nr:hypothetical protein [Thermoleophilaceae bacterium]